jgi:hypothetical protein
MQPSCNASFKTIEDALKIRPNCPFCKEKLISQLQICYIENRETFRVSEFNENVIKYHYSDDFLPEGRIINVTLDVKRNHFDFNITKDDGRDSVTDTLNGPNVYLYKECEKCKYTIAWLPFLFMADSSYFKFIRLWAETWEDGTMIIRNDFVGDQLTAYKTNNTDLLFSKSHILELTEQNANTIPQKIKTFIVFS